MKAETRHPEPLIRPALLHRRALRDATTLAFLLGLWNGGEMLVLSLYLQQVLHESPLFTGLVIAPQGVVGFRWACSARAWPAAWASSACSC